MACVRARFRVLEVLAVSFSACVVNTLHASVGAFVKPLASAGGISLVLIYFCICVCL